MYQRILVPVDGSETSNAGLLEAARLAALTHGKVRLVHVVDDLSFCLSVDGYSGYATDWVDDLRKAGEQMLSEAEVTVKSLGVEVDHVLLDDFGGSVQERITAEAEKWPADLVVIGTHGRRGVGRMLLGSSAENVLRSSSVPVLLVRTPVRPPVRPPVHARTRPAGDTAIGKTAVTADSTEGASLTMPAGSLAME